MRSIDFRTETKMALTFIALLVVLISFLNWRIDVTNERKEAKKQAEFAELSAIKSDIQNIYTKMILIHQEIGEHEVRIHKLEPESPIIKTYLKNMKILTETINMHRRELRKCQKKEQ